MSAPGMVTSRSSPMGDQNHDVTLSRDRDVVMCAALVAGSGPWNQTRGSVDR